MKRQFAFVFLAGLGLFDANTGAETLTLRKAFTLADGNTDDMAIIKERYQAGQYEVQSVKSAVYPRLDFSANATHLSTSAQAIGPFLEGIQGIPDRFNGQEYGWNMHLEQPLITFGRLGVLIKIARRTLNGLELQYDLEREAYYLDIVRAYADAATQRTLYESAGNTVSYLSRLESFVNIEKQGGARSQVEWMRVQSRLQMARADSSKYYIQWEASLFRLKSLLNLPTDDKIEVEPLSEESLALPQKPDSIHRKDLEIQRIQEEVSRYWAKYERANLMPAISLVGNVSDKVQEYSDPAEANFAGLVSPDYFNYSLGLQLKWTLFDGFATTSKARQKLSEAKIAQREWKKRQREVLISQRESTQQLQTTRVLVEASQMARDAAKTTFEQGEKDFKNGIIPLNQLLELESEYHEAEASRASAQASRTLAKANYYIAHGISLAEGMQ